MTAKAMENQYAGTLKRFVQEELLNGQTTVEVDDDLLSAGMIDSMGMMWLLGYIESEFTLTVPPEDVTIEHFRTITTIVKYLEKRSEAGNRAL